MIARFALQFLFLFSFNFSYNVILLSAKLATINLLDVYICQDSALKATKVTSVKQQVML